MPGNARGVRKRLQNVARRSDAVTARKMDLTPTTPGERSRFAVLQADTVRMFNPEKPLRISVPAYESFTTNATAGDTETFNLANDLADTPSGQDVVLWEAGTLVQPDSVDYSTDSFTYTDDGTGNNLYVWYRSGDSATIEIEKATAGGQHREDLYTGNLSLIHDAEQSKRDSAEYLDQQAGDDGLKFFQATDMKLEVHIDAPYEVRRTDPNGAGAVATNMLVHIPGQKGEKGVEGLKQAIVATMR